MARSATAVFLAVSTVATAVPASAAAATETSSWLWQGPDLQALDGASAAGIDTLYVHTWPDTTVDPRWDEFFAAAATADIAVHALAGDPTWASENRSHLLAWIDRVVADGRFDGIVVDVEPYLLSDWTDRKQGRRLRASFVDTLGIAEARAGALTLRAVVPFWYDDASYAHRKRGTLLEQVVAQVDGIVVMAYRDRLDGSDGILALAGFEVDAAAAAGVTAVIAVEARDSGTDKVDFSAEGRAALDAALATVASTWAGHPGFGGTSVHDLAAYLLLPQ